MCCMIVHDVPNVVGVVGVSVRIQKGSNIQHYLSTVKKETGISGSHYEYECLTSTRISGEYTTYKRTRCWPRGATGRRPSRAPRRAARPQSCSAPGRHATSDSPGRAGCRAAAGRAGHTAGGVSMAAVDNTQRKEIYLYCTVYTVHLSSNSQRFDNLLK